MNDGVIITGTTGGERDTSGDEMQSSALNISFLMIPLERSSGVTHD